MTYDASLLRSVRFWCSGFASNVRFCTLSALTFPEPIRSNPKLRAETCASDAPGAENPNGNTGLNGGVTPDQTVTGCYAKLRQVTVSYGRLRSKFFQAHRYTPATPRCNTRSKSAKSLHRVAACCSVLHRVSLEIFSPVNCNTSTNLDLFPATASTLPSGPICSKPKSVTYVLDHECYLCPDPCPSGIHPGIHQSINPVPQEKAAWVFSVLESQAPGG
jgi:hypothetical protein